MCGLAGLVSTSGQRIGDIKKSLVVMGQLIAHRGPDGQGTWVNETETCGLAHRRLSVIDLSELGSQPMTDEFGNTVVFNGEIYNYRELRKACSAKGYRFKSNSDTEVILALYHFYGVSSVEQLRGMFSFVIWDEGKRELFAARDRFGIKPFYYCRQGDQLLFASEAKSLLPFLDSIDTDDGALAEYLTFQYQLGSETLFKSIFQLQPAHILRVRDGLISTHRYWDVSFEIEWGRSASEIREQTKELIQNSVAAHLVSDVEIGAYLSGGLDSTLIARLATDQLSGNLRTFNGRFTDFEGYDESSFAIAAAKEIDSSLTITDITANDFVEEIRNVLWHLDFPVAGPGAFPQYMVSRSASEYVKVVLGGQGGDEIFGGYARYLIAYFEQCIKAAIDGTYQNGNFVVTIESIVPHLGVLREYKPLLQEFWKEGLFGPLDQRFFRLINRSSDMKDEVNWHELDQDRVTQRFLSIFNSRSNVGKEAYFDSMTHFEFKTLLPALLQVEDRMSMAHGLESRVPLLDHQLIEYVAGVPADVKFEGGQLKQLLKSSFENEIPSSILKRRDKMGFPVPLKEWFEGPLSTFVQDVFSNMSSSQRSYINSEAVQKNMSSGGRFSRKTWALLSLEIWQQEFHDKASEYRALLK